MEGYRGRVPRYAAPIRSPTFLVPTGTAAQCRRCKPPVSRAASAGGEWEANHPTKHNRAAISLSSAQLRLDRVWWCGQLTARHLRSRLTRPSAHADGMGLPSLSGLRKCSRDWFMHRRSKYFTYQVFASSATNAIVSDCLRWKVVLERRRAICSIAAALLGRCLESVGDEVRAPADAGRLGYRCRAG